MLSRGTYMSESKTNTYLQWKCSFCLFSGKRGLLSCAGDALGIDSKQMLRWGRQMDPVTTAHRGSCTMELHVEWVLGSRFSLSPLGCGERGDVSWG